MEMEETASTTQFFSLGHRKTHTFAHYSSVINITGGKCVLPGAALIGGNQNEKSRQTACAFIDLDRLLGMNLQIRIE
jgi:hypothetical protein